jgi:hypothetical protein
MALQALGILPFALVRIVKKGERKLELRSIGFSSRVLGFNSIFSGAP